MRILVGIANYGNKNRQYAERLFDEYRSMPFEVKLVVLSEAPKRYADDVTVLVGLPEKDPWSLPFVHKKLFAENVNNYDLFIYSEDDTLISRENVIAFLEATKRIGDEVIPGFMRYELYPNGKKNYPEFHGSYHWSPNSVRASGGYTYAKFSNEHSACYMLTSNQLKSAIASGGYLVEPHRGRYDLICSAGTDPYTQCGLSKVVCFSHLKDFEVHHLPNLYLDRLGLGEDSFRVQIEALSEILHDVRNSQELLKTEKPLATVKWDKNYYEPCRQDVLRCVPYDAKEILSIGCGWGATEGALVDRGCRVAAIPLDSVIGKLAERRGIEVFPPDFHRAFEMLNERRFDAVICSEVLQHLPSPIEILAKLGQFLKAEGSIVGSVPNLSLGRRVVGRLVGRKWARIKGTFEEINLSMTTKTKVQGWLSRGGLHAVKVAYSEEVTADPRPVLRSRLAGGVTAPNILFSAKLSNS